jgi:hypothetical protein
MKPKNHKETCQCGVCKGIRNPKEHNNYIDGRTMIKYYCKCGKEIKHYYNKRCKSCGTKLSWKRGNRQQRRTYIGKNNPNFKDGRSLNNRCKDCGIDIKRQTTRCDKCENKHHSLSIKGRLNFWFGKHPFTHRKKIKYKNIRMRSGWEVAYAKYLDKRGIKWQYESKTFDLGDTTYTPDFCLPETDTYIEIKGYFDKKGKDKFYLFKKLFPETIIKLYRYNHLKRMRILI